MPGKPDHGVFGSRNRRPRGNEWALDHNHGQSQRARRLDLGRSSMAARILRQNHFNAMLRKQTDIVFSGEWPACGNKVDVGKAVKNRRLVDEPDDISVMRRSVELREDEAANAKDPARLGPKRCYGRSHVGNLDPAVAWLTFPGRSFHGKKRRTGDRGCRDGIAADLGGKGMGRVRQDIDALVPEVTGKPFNPAKAAASNRNWLSARHRRPSRKRQGCLETLVGSEHPRKRARLRGAAEEKNAHGSRF